MAQSIQSNLNRLNQSVRDKYAKVVCATLLFASGQALANEFTDRLNNAKAIDTTALRESAGRASDNFGAIFQYGIMFIGFVFFAWGVLWVMKANRDEGGRMNAGPGYVMVIGGGVLGAGMAVYAFSVGVLSGVTA